MTEILHLHSGNLYGGIESSMVTMVRFGAPRIPLRSHFALCFEGRLSRELRAADAHVYDMGRVRFRRPWTVLRARRRLRRLLREKQFAAAICHGSWAYAIFAPVARSLGLPIIYWSHNIPSGSFLERWAARMRPDLVLANSGITRQAVLTHFRGIPCLLFHSPVPPPDAFGSARERTRLGFDTPKDTVVIVMTSRLEPWKGHALLLQALGHLRAVNGWVAWIAGGSQRPQEQKYLDDLVAEVGRLGIAERTRFLGERHDIPLLLQASDIHCQPNTGPEPFGLAFIEALYAGLPVVTTAIGAAPEIVDEHCGVLVPPEDPATLAAVLARLIGDAEERRRLGRGAMARAAELCDPGRQIGQLLEIVKSVSVRG
jgi:glycosyltransferase involved in cell wall biosynthesis